MAGFESVLGSQIFKAQSNDWAFLYEDYVMPYWVYILQSQPTGKYYCGHSDNVERRVKQHNDPEYRGSRTTKVFIAHLM